MSRPTNGPALPDEIEARASGGNPPATLHMHRIHLPAAQIQIALTRTMTRAAIRVHDIGLRMHRNGAGETGFEVVVGGGP